MNTRGRLRQDLPAFAVLRVVATTLLFTAFTSAHLTAQTERSLEARRLQQQAAELRAKGNHRDAVALLRDAASLLAQEFGPEAGVVGDATNLVGAALFQAGMYPEAAAEFERALSIRRKAVAQTLNNLANAVRGHGDVVRAEQLLLEGLALQEQLRGPGDIEVAKLSTNLASLYDQRGDFARAEPMYQRALKIVQTRNLRSDDSFLAVLLTNLGLLYQNRGDLDAARPLLEQALQLRETLLSGQPDHPQIATAAINLASNYQESGKLEAAESLYKRAFDIFARRSELDTRPVSTLSVNLAMVHLLRGEYDRAEPLYQRSLAIREKLLGATHPDTGAAQERLAVFYQVVGRRADALAALRRSAEVVEHNLALTLAAGSEQQKISYMDTVQENTDILLSMREQLGAGEFDELAIATVIQRKGRVLDALVDLTARLRQSIAAEDQATFDELSKARTELANLVGAGIPAAATDHAERVERLRIQIDTLEQRLSRTSAQMRGEVRPVTISDVLSALPAGTALVEFVKYRPFDPRAVGRFKRFGQPRYAAFVLRAGRQTWVELGAAEDIETSLTAWRTALRSPRDSSVREKGRAVYQRLMAPLEKLVPDTTQLFIVPDDVLNLLPFSALTTTDDAYLIESRAVTYLASSRDVLRFAKGPGAREPALIVAAPDFGPARRPTASPGPSFAPLPGAAREGKSIAQHLPGARLIEGRAATESLVKSVHGPVVLHFATHAFFVAATPASPSGDAGSARGLNVVERVRIEPTPLLRAGIALAGAGSVAETGEDGVLTALEAASLDLRGTKLVVLSACESGLGEIRAGDGVHGFRRALTLAGAESQVVTLWRVDDHTTADLMTHFYRALRNGASRQAALRDAQLAIFRDAARSHPFYWAAFAAAGEVSPIVSPTH